MLDHSVKMQDDVNLQHYSLALTLNYVFGYL